MYFLTSRRLAACRANLIKARAAPRPPERYARSRRNSLRHGFYTQALRESVTRLGESLEEFDEYLWLFARAFAPQDETENTIVRHLGETAWRRLRLYRAHIRAEARVVWRLLSSAEVKGVLSAEETGERATALLVVLLNQMLLLKRLARLAGHMERLLRALIKRRSGGTINFRVFARVHAKEATLLLKNWVPTFDGLRRLLN